MIKNFKQFSSEFIFESVINESIVYFSPRMREQLVQIDSNISKRLLELEGTDVKNVDVTFIDSDRDGNVTFITMPNAMKLIKAKYPAATNADLDVSGDKQVADYVFANDMNSLDLGYSNGDTGVYIKSRNTIKIGKLVNRLFKGTLSNAEVEKFVNDFKSSIPSAKEKIDIVSGEMIRYWYDENNYFVKKGTLGNSCMANKPGKYFNIYAENPDTCNLLIMTVDNKLVARALVWKLNSTKSADYADPSADGNINDNNRPEYFLDRVYSIEDYQVEKMRKFAIDKGWAVRKWNSGHQYESILWKNKNYDHVSMSVKVKKSNYGDTFPYMDTFVRYDHFNGLLWNDEKRRKGGHILHSTQGGYDKSISRSRVYINKFKDFFKKDD